MEIQLIRNASLRITYSNAVILVDPYFAPKHTLPSYADKSMNPLIDLPVSVSEILRDVELILISHLHTDHFDDTAKEAIPKNVPIFCQPNDVQAIQEAGFQAVQPVDDSVAWKGITLARTGGQHGEGETARLMGQVSGFVLEATQEPTLYLAGDTIWVPAVEHVISQKKPDVIVTHSSGAVWKGSPPIVMDAAQTVTVAKRAPAAQVVAVHMEALDHGTVSREELRDYAKSQGISAEQLLIPEDGETLVW